MSCVSRLKSAPFCPLPSPMPRSGDSSPAIDLVFMDNVLPYYDNSCPLESGCSQQKGRKSNLANFAQNGILAKLFHFVPAAPPQSRTPSSLNDSMLSHLASYGRHARRALARCVPSKSIEQLLLMALPPWCEANWRVFPVDDVFIVNTNKIRHEIQ